MSRHVSNDLKARAKKLAAKKGISYSAALALIRTPSVPAPAAPPAPTTWVVPQYLYIELPAPELRGATPCADCEGSGVTGDTFMAGGEDGSGNPPLLVELACPTCLGCGRAEHDEENGCGTLHAEGDEDLRDELRDELLDEWDDEPLGESDECNSCYGFRFSYVQVLMKDDNGEPEKIAYLRHPCGCMEDQARIITGDPVKAGA